jgi:hypothetical protein
MACASAPTSAFGIGITSEQSTILLLSCPSTASFAIADWKAEAMCAWLFTFACQKHAVRESCGVSASARSSQRSCKIDAYPCQLRVALQADLAVQRRLDLALVAPRAGEQRAAQLRLDEELCIENEWRRVERRAGDRRVDVVRRGDRVPIV